MRWLFPSRTPFIPSKCYASLYRYTTVPSPIPPSFPRQVHLFSAQASPSPPIEATFLRMNLKFFFTPCKLLAYGEMNATQRAVLRNILREDLVCI